MGGPCVRDLGKMGERYFDAWCASAGITSNNSNTDETGWDYLLEFPFIQKKGVPLDEQGAAFECKVQIKSTDDRKGKWSIKLSNLKRFVNTPLPSFFVFLEFDNIDTPQSGYIVHVDETLIGKILKRLRELDEIEEDVKLNKKTFTIHYDESHKLAELNGNCLKQSFEQYIGDSFEEYITDKRRIIKTVGFSEGAGEITFSTKGEESTLELVKASVGISDFAEIYDIVSRHKRFGILSQKPQFNYPVAQLKFDNIKPQSIGKIRFKESKYSSYISLPAKLYISPLNTVIPDTFRLFRVAGASFEFLINPITTHSTYTMKLNDEGYQDFIELNETVKLFAMLSKPNIKLISVLDFDIFPEIRFNIVTHLDNPTINEDFQKSLEYVDIIATDFGIKQDLQINIYELMNNMAEFERFSNMLTSSHGYTIAEFRVDDGLNLDNQIICIFFNGILIGNHILGAVISIKTKKLKMLPDNFYRVTSDELIVEKRIIISTGETLRKSEIKSMVQETQKKYDLPGITAVTLFLD